MCLLPLFVHTVFSQMKLAVSAVQRRLGKKAPRPPAILICVANPHALPCVHAITGAGWTCHRVPRLRYIDRAARALDAAAVVTDRIASVPDRSSGPVSGTLPLVLLGPPRRAADALKAGAALFVPVPIDGPALVAGLSRIIQHPARDEPKTGVDENGLWLDALTAQVRVGDTPIALSPRHFCVLHELVRNPGKLLTTERLCSGLTGVRPMTPAALTICISRLRKLLRDAGAPDCIETVHCLGYRYIVAAAPLAAPLPAAIPAARHG
ncbi:winged helix-turn-helix domain-containing protein [Acidiferrobacter sp.]|uniref:winged helix-turn-helix domain-containing protein n=1 Tax=Acidiferrobacter sp. TaxID=1872107 RepID=UPI00260DFB10|nr:winged helix-turn-helix domain-containing protein [Acidiferrobacter sp.]